MSNFTEKFKAFRKTFRGANLEYCDPQLKKSYHLRGQRLMKVLAVELGLGEGTYDIRSNKAGVAFSGEVTLHGERIYVQLSQWALGQGKVAGNPGGHQFLIRAVKGRKDFAGGYNSNYPLGGEPADFLEIVRARMNEPRR